VLSVMRLGLQQCFSVCSLWRSMEYCPKFAKNIFGNICIRKQSTLIICCFISMCELKYRKNGLNDCVMMDARTSETSVKIQLRTRQYIPEDSELLSNLNFSRWLRIMNREGFKRKWSSPVPTVSRNSSRGAEENYESFNCDSRFRS
jgi:hypothetical protein